MPWLVSSCGDSTTCPYRFRDSARSHTARDWAVQQVYMRGMGASTMRESSRSPQGYPQCWILSCWSFPSWKNVWDAFLFIMFLFSEREKWKPGGGVGGEGQLIKGWVIKNRKRFGWVSSARVAPKPPLPISSSSNGQGGERTQTHKTHSRSWSRTARGPPPQNCPCPPMAGWGPASPTTRKPTSYSQGGEWMQMHKTHSCSRSRTAHGPPTKNCPHPPTVGWDAASLTAHVMRPTCPRR